MKPRPNSPATRRISVLLWIAAGIGAMSAAGVVRATSAPQPAATPQGAIEMLYSGLVSAAAGNLNVEQRYARLEPVIEATHDLQYIAKLTIRREWDGLTAEQRQRFVAAFERLSVMTYASRFGTLEPNMFKIDASEPAADDRAEVKATLTTRAGKQIPFQYLLHREDGGWKIINILADNVSDLALKRAEYHEVLENGSVDDLIEHVEKQAEEAAREGQVKYR